MPEHPADSARQPGWSTRSVHAGDRRPFPEHALSLPIYQTATYTFDSTDDLREFMQARLWGPVEGRTEYGRYGNPTVAALESKLAELEGAGEAVLFGSGMAAITTTLLSLLSAGDHLIITDDSYRRTRQFCLTILKRLGIECTVVPAGDLAQLELAVRPETRLIVSESPTNPYLRIVDLERLAQIARAAGVKTLIDGTFATPINQRPLEFGIDLVVHSATKYLAGHNDLLAGVVAGSEYLVALIRQHLWVMGATCDPHAAYLAHRGIKTLGLRMSRHNESAQRLAQFLERHPKVERVWYPGLASHPDHEVARRQMRGFGGVVSFEVAGGLEAASRLVDSVRLPLIASSLGGVETLIEQPALMSYFELSSEERMKVGIKDNLVRMSIGIEEAEDLIADIERALDSLP